MILFSNSKPILILNSVKNSSIEILPNTIIANFGFDTRIKKLNISTTTNISRINKRSLRLMISTILYKTMNYPTRSNRVSTKRITSTLFTICVNCINSFISRALISYSFAMRSYQQLILSIYNWWWIPMILIVIDFKLNQHYFIVINWTCTPADIELS